MAFCCLQQPKKSQPLVRLGRIGSTNSRRPITPQACHHRTCTGDVVALGDGQVGAQKRDFQLQVGNTVLYNKFGLGVTDVEIQGVEHMLIKEDDCIGTMPRSGATADDIPELRPLGDRILIKVGCLLPCQHEYASKVRPACVHHQRGGLCRASHWHGLLDAAEGVDVGFKPGIGYCVVDSQA